MTNVLRKFHSSSLLLLSVFIVMPVFGQEFVLKLRPAISEPPTMSAKLLRGVREMSEARYMSIEKAQMKELIASRPQQVTLELPQSLGLPPTVTLRSNELFTPNAQVVVRTEQGDQVVPFIGQWATYRGSFQGLTGSLVVLNVSRFGIDGYFDVKSERYYLKPLSDVSDAAQSHVLVPARAMNQKPFFCGNDLQGDPPGTRAFIEELKQRQGLTQEKTLSQTEPAPFIPQLPMSLGALKGAISTDTIEVQVALEGDYDLTVTTGGVDSALALMLATVSYSSAIYERDVQVKLTVPFVRVWETPSDPFAQEIFTALNQLASSWKSTMDSVQRTTVHLFVSSTQWPSQTGVAGVARLNTLCSTVNGYGVTDVRNPATEDHLMTFAHELGHNFGAHHTHSCLWPNGPIDYCSEVEGDCYSGPIVQQTGTIMSYCSPRVFEFGPIVSALMRRNAEVAWCAPSVAQVSVAAADSVFLQSLYSDANGSAWTNKTNWTGPVVGRYGVAVRSGRVVSIDLAANNLQGALPAGLTNLTELRRLNLSGRNHYRITEVDPPDPPTDLNAQNRLTGQIPSNIQDLTKLEFLDVSNNLLSGTIPSGIGSLNQLLWLNLSENELTGTIPTSLGNLTNMELLDLSRNRLTGGIPAELGTMSNLRYLTLTENGLLGGSIPAALGSISKLVVFLAYKSGLTGSIPIELGNLMQLTNLDLSTNQLTGAIPSELGNISGLLNLSLMENQLTGSIPSSLGNLQKMVGLRLGSNMLSGALPPELGNMNLWALFLGKNQLTGTIPLSFGKLTQVVELDLSENQLMGTLPDTLKHIGENFYPGLGGFFEFTVNDNQLTGPLPDWLGQGTQFNTLSTLKLGGNNFTVTTIPSWITSKTNLGRLWLHDLGFTGTIPAELGSITFLFELKLSGNQFTGAIPPELGNLTSLRLLWLSNNQLSGAIPSQLGNLTGILYLRLSQNQLTGNVPAGFSSMTNLAELALNDNSLENLPNLSSMNGLKQNPAAFTAIQNNKLTFDDVAPLVGLGLRNFTYAPQKPFGAPRTISISPGSDVLLTVKPDGTNNTYQWKKNGTNIGGATSRDYQLTAVSSADSGDYAVEVTSESVPSLALQREPLMVRLHNLAYPQDMTLVSPADGAVGLIFPVTLSWNLEAMATRYDVQIDTSGTFVNLLFRDSTVTTLSRMYTTSTAATRYYWRVRAANNQGVGFWSDVRSFATTGVGTVVYQDGSSIPSEFGLSQNYPNPFNPATEIRYQISEVSHVVLKIYDVLGREVATLVNQHSEPGSFRVQWDAAGFASGMYIYHMKAGTFEAARKMFLVK